MLLSLQSYCLLTSLLIAHFLIEQSIWFRAISTFNLSRTIFKFRYKNSKTLVESNQLILSIFVNILLDYFHFDTCSQLKSLINQYLCKHMRFMWTPAFHNPFSVFIYYTSFEWWNGNGNEYSKWVFPIQINIYSVEFISIHSISIMKTNVYRCRPCYRYCWQIIGQKKNCLYSLFACICKVVFNVNWKYILFTRSFFFFHENFMFVISFSRNIGNGMLWHNKT